MVDGNPHPLTIVLKLGSSSILQPDPPYAPQIATLSAICEVCVALRSLGHRVVIVSSGAVGMGLHRMGLPAGKRPMGEKQALAAVGQGRLIALWDQLFGLLGQSVAQVLLTRNDIADRSRYLNATTTLSTLLQLGVIPIINENDTVSVSEILRINKFGDNDTLSAIAAGMCGADYLFLLTDVDGLYEDNPRRVPGARRVAVVRDIEEVRKMVSTATLGSSLGTGGMETKLIAAELATAAGCATVITLGSAPSRMLDIVQQHHNRPAATTLPSASAAAAAADPDSFLLHATSPLPPVEFAPPTATPPHTLFLPGPNTLTSRRFWILHGLTPRGTVYVDEGAYRAMSRANDGTTGGGNGGRLLAAGVLRVEGSFAAGQAVKVCVIRGRWSKRRQAPEGRERPDPSRPASPERPRTAEVAEDNESEEILEFGRGLTNYNSAEIDRVKGMRSTDIERMLGYSEAEHVVESIVELPAVAKERERRSSATLL